MQVEFKFNRAIGDLTETRRKILSEALNSTSGLPADFEWDFSTGQSAIGRFKLSQIANVRESLLFTRCAGLEIMEVSEVKPQPPVKEMEPVICPVCGATPGLRCKTPSGRSTKNPHAERLKVWKNALSEAKPH